jgi:DNA repair/transcription protein MET18/MMS19
VLKELLKALDDPKKAVRKEAVDARSVWYVTSG